MLNKCILMGRLTAAPELKQTTSGTAIGKFKMAIDRKFQKNGERQMDFLPVLCFGKQAEFVHKYFDKGQMICVVGSVQTRTWDGNDGRKNYATEIIADEVSFCGDRKKDTQDNSIKNNPDNSGFMPIDADDTLPF